MDRDKIIYERSVLAERRVKPIIIEPDPSPYKEVTRVICPKCGDLLLTYYNKDLHTQKDGDPHPLDKYNYCRNCGLGLDMRDFRFIHCVG